MKKCLSIICTLIILFSISSPAYASDYYKNGGDSSDIPEEVLALLPLKYGDQVIRIYTVNAFMHFSTCNNIVELFHANYTDFMIFYAVISSDGTVTDYCIIDGQPRMVERYVAAENDEWTVVNYYDHLHRILDLYLQGDVLKSIDPNISIENAYYVATYDEGDIIYYETNMGEYVYCNFQRYFPYRPDKGEFIFSLEAFCEYQRIVYAACREFMKENPYAVGGAGGSNTVANTLDLSAYQIGSPNFDPNAPFPVPSDDDSVLWLIGGITLAVVLTAAAACFFLRRRKNRNTPNDQVSE